MINVGWDRNFSQTLQDRKNKSHKYPMFSMYLCGFIYSERTIVLKTFSICSTVYSEEQLKLLMMSEKHTFFPDIVSA